MSGHICVKRSRPGLEEDGSAFFRFGCALCLNGFEWVASFAGVQQVFWLHQFFAALGNWSTLGSGARLIWGRFGTVYHFDAGYVRVLWV